MLSLNPSARMPGMNSFLAYSLNRGPKDASSNCPGSRKYPTKILHDTKCIICSTAVIAALLFSKVLLAKSTAINNCRRFFNAGQLPCTKAATPLLRGAPFSNRATPWSCSFVTVTALLFAAPALAELEGPMSTLGE
jgi:hypothetical protein